MRRGLILLTCFVMLPGLPGCLWLTGAAVVAVVATNDSEGDSSGSDPVVVPEAAFEGAFIPLEENPTDVLVADLIPDGKGSLDIAVLSRSTLAVTVLPGDGSLGTLRGDVHHLLGDGRGEFRTDRASVVFAGGDLEDIQTADLDGDGMEEVLASVGVPGLVILRSKLARGEHSSSRGE